MCLMKGAGECMCVSSAVTNVVVLYNLAQLDHVDIK